MSDENFWPGSFDSLPEKLVDWICYENSSISFKMQRENHSCFAFLTICRQEIHLFVVHYVATQHLPFEVIIDGVHNQRDDYHKLPLHGHIYRPFLTGFAEIINYGLRRGIVDIGVSLIFLKVLKKIWNTLKLHHQVPRDEVLSDNEVNFETLWSENMLHWYSVAC